MPVEPYEAYANYQAIKLHFTSKSYDAAKYNFTTKSVSKKSFFKRNDRYFFTKISRKFNNVNELRDFYTVNFVYGKSSGWIKDFVDDKAFDLYKTHLSKTEGFTYVFTNDIISLRDKMIMEELDNPDLLLTQIEPDTDFPYIINMVLQRDILLETFILLNRTLGCLSGINKSILNESGGAENFIWNELQAKIKKYDRLMKPYLNNDQVKSILLKHLLN